MTAAEHQLIFEMFKEQQRQIATLTELLRARDTLKDGDLEAFHDVLESSGKMTVIEKTLAGSYRGCAALLDIETDLILSTDALG